MTVGWQLLRKDGPGVVMISYPSISGLLFFLFSFYPLSGLYPV